MLDFRIHTFLTVCETMNFTRAAEILGLTQPAVSQHIHYLEALYDVPLFFYERKKLTLTDAGILLRNASKTISQDNSFLAEKMRNPQALSRPLRFGATLTIAEFVLPKHLSNYMQAHPNQEIHVLSANTQELLNKLDHGLIDLALVEGYFPRGEYSQQLFSQECYLAVCSPDYPLPANPCRLEDLLGERLILRESGSGTRDILEKYLDAKGLSVEDFRTRTVLSNLGGIIELASLGCGVTFLYERAVRRELAAKKLRIIPLQDLNISHDFSFLWRKNSIFHSEYAALCKEL